MASLNSFWPCLVNEQTKADDGDYDDDYDDDNDDDNNDDDDGNDDEDDDVKYILK